MHYYDEGFSFLLLLAAHSLSGDIFFFFLGQGQRSTHHIIFTIILLCHSAWLTLCCFIWGKKNHKKLYLNVAWQSGTFGINIYQLLKLLLFVTLVAFFLRTPAAKLLTTISISCQLFVTSLFSQFFCVLILSIYVTALLFPLSGAGEKVKLEHQKKVRSVA